MAPESIPFNPNRLRDLNAERAVLALAFQHPGIAREAVARLRPEDFTTPFHAAVFATMGEQLRAGETIDPITTHTRLRAGHDGHYGDCYHELVALAAGEALESAAQTYIAAVRDAARRRETQNLCRKLIADAAVTATEDELLDPIEEQLQAILQNDDRRFVPAGAVAAAEAQTLLENASPITGVPTGFGDFDALTRGLQPGELTLIAARPAMGKTALALCIAHHAAVKAGFSVGMTSLEMDIESLSARLLAIDAGVSLQRLFRGRLDKQDWRKLVAALQALNEARLAIDDAPNQTVAEIARQARRLKTRAGLDLLIIDYLQLITGAGKTENRQAEVAQISRELKLLAKDFAIPVLAMCQLNRAPELRANHRPILSDLRESGALEQDADLVVFLYRDEVYHPSEQNRGRAELILAKQRNGPVGVVHLTFLSEYCAFFSAWREDEKRESEARTERKKTSPGGGR